ncbi:hypothetical protein [Aeromicrobium duanguangcaii]|uniref:Uncharacterized protein n=1 Tax=Aeromicrobium duanguangcaii TaxID=2968086 RepID=A0ABY5KG76_9ACTN|nr:hypothetical protein [Aeromicrobium duanguangcaii]MCL3837341.1 hypothetical protein [Aeromicrobium duanguangcaii]UUI67373.1 hypothetical protein NP095_09125 [Aeromicrobium duanguangcaii]
MSSRTVRRLASVLVALPLVLFAGASPATADATVDAVVPQGDGTVVLVVAVEDGCGEAPTTGLTLQVPESSAVISATAPDGWDGVLDGRRVDFTGPGLPPRQVAEFLLTSRIGAAAGERVTLVAEQRCGDGMSGSRSTPDFTASAETVDPAMTVTVPQDVPAGADGRDVVVAVVGFTLLVAATAWWGARRRRRVG